MRHAESALYFPVLPGILRGIMDWFWSIFTMPIGVALCFGPAVIVWWLTKEKSPSEQKPEKH